MDMSVNQSRSYIFPLQVNLLDAVIRTDSHDHAVFHSHIALLDGFRKYIDNLRVFQYQFRFFPSAGRGNSLR